MAEDLDVLAHDAVEQIQLHGVQGFIFRGAIRFFRIIGGLWLLTGTSLNTNNDEERSDKGFLQVGKAEAFRDCGDCFAELRGKVNRFVSSEFGSIKYEYNLFNSDNVILPPVIAVLFPLWGSWEGKVVFAIKAAGSLRNACIQTLDFETVSAIALQVASCG